MKCADCKHWGIDDDAINALYDTKRCGKAIQAWNAGEWTWDEEADERGFSLQPEYSDQMMFVQDGSDYRADLYTRPNFFCAHFEQDHEPSAGICR